MKEFGAWGIKVMRFACICPLSDWVFIAMFCFYAAGQLGTELYARCPALGSVWWFLFAWVVGLWSMLLLCIDGFCWTILARAVFVLRLQ